MSAGPAMTATGLVQNVTNGPEPLKSAAPRALGAKERGECGWCEAGRERFFGCCGRTLPHHHTLVVLNDAVMNRKQSAWVRQRTVRIIASDDCPDLPESAA